MQLKNLLLGAGTAMALVASAGAAQAATGYYLNMGVGFNWLQDADFTGNTAGGPVVTGNAEFKSGWVVAGAVGYDWGHWRAEFELAFRQNDAECVSLGGPPCFPVPGAEIWEFSQMINVYYDIDLGGRWGASLGAGVGGNLVAADAGLFALDDADDYTLAGQLIAELNYEISDRWILYANYRFMFMDDPSLEGGPIFGPGGSIDVEKSDHAVMIGLRFDLHRDGAPREPDRPTPGDSRRPKQFIVFFGFNKSNLSAEAQRVVAEAAAAAKEYGSAEIVVVGHTDTVGSPGYNMRLSLRRAGAVKSELSRRGIKPSMITTEGKGETELMVQTGDGVKEPQNRRTTIDLE